jgi:copper chaperone NosL
MKRQYVAICIITILSLFVISGCGKKEHQPVAINEKTDKCDICNMAVKDNQFSTEIFLDNGKSMVFDDMGCMDKWVKKNKDKKISIAYVRDYNSKKWIDSKKATYVYDKSIRTAMAYNVIAFIDKKDAQKFIADHKGKLLSYDELQKHSWEQNEDMVKEMKKKKMEMDSAKKDMNTGDSNSH